MSHVDGTEIFINYGWVGVAQVQEHLAVWCESDGRELLAPTKSPHATCHTTHHTTPHAVSHITSHSASLIPITPAVLQPVPRILRSITSITCVVGQYFMPCVSLNTP